MKKSYLLMVLPVVAIILELLPIGAVCIFASPTETVRETYSYFSLVPYGYADFGPLITAALTCAMLIVAVIAFCSKNPKLVRAILVIGIIALITSFLPLVHEIRYMSVVGDAICVVMAVQVVMAIVMDRTWMRNAE